MALYELNALTKTYAGRAVLAIGGLSIEAGEIMAIVGPSGAGKSTLLRLLNFLEPPSSGQLIFEGQAVPVRPPLELIRRVTTVFQRPALLSGSVSENVAFGLRLRGTHDRDRVQGALKRVGLADLAGAAANTLSGGEMQRAALARALVMEPQVLLLDEPTANLDPGNVALIESIVKQQNADRGTTVILVTHNIFQARRLATRVGLLLNGALVELAATDRFFDSPVDPRTAAFVRGDMAY